LKKSRKSPVLNPSKRRSYFFIVPLFLLSVSLPVRLFAADSPDTKSNWLKKLAAPKEESESNQPATVAGVRGLDDPAKGGDSKARDYDAIDRMDKLKITPQELKLFMKDGELI
jgi:hypothetical protein